MTEDSLALVIQTAAVVIAVGASVVALVISAKDRQNARVIAEADRRHSLRQAKLLFDLTNLLRLLENRNRGGSTDPHEIKRMGAEAITLVGLIGRDLLPRQWDRQVGEAGDLNQYLEDDDFPEYKKDAIEAQIAVDRIVREINSLSKGE